MPDIKILGLSRNFDAVSQRALQPIYYSLILFKDFGGYVGRRVRVLQFFLLFSGYQKHLRSALLATVNEDNEWKVHVCMKRKGKKATLR